jgi:hypothetical protein
MASANGLPLDLDDLPALIAALRRVALPDTRPPPKTDGGMPSHMAVVLGVQPLAYQLHQCRLLDRFALDGLVDLRRLVAPV